MNKLIFVTGLANGGKTTTIRAFINLFGKEKTGCNISINNSTYQVRDYSNCDAGWDRFVERVRKFSINKNLIYPLCLDIKNKKNNHADFNQIMEFLNSLESSHTLYFFIIKNGHKNRSLKIEDIQIITKKYDFNEIIDNDSADNSSELKKFIEKIN